MRTYKRSLNSPVAAWAYLTRIYFLVARCVESELKSQGLTMAQFDVLLQLYSRQKCCTQEALCQDLLVTKGNVSGLVSRMVRDKMVLREVDQENRRCHRIALTPKGRAVFEKSRVRHEECLGDVFDVLNHRDQEILEALLGQFLIGLRQRMSQGGE